jgi:hypothetical protein
MEYCCVLPKAIKLSFRLVSWQYTPAPEKKTNFITLLSRSIKGTYVRGGEFSGLLEFRFNQVLPDTVIIIDQIFISNNLIPLCMMRWNKLSYIGSPLHQFHMTLKYELLSSRFLIQIIELHGTLSSLSLSLSLSLYRAVTQG